MAECNPRQEGIKKLQEEITCPLCLDNFDDPKRLSCGHIYCKVPCLQGLLLRSVNSTVTCPECRNIAQIPANDLDNLPNAFQINRLKEVYSDLSKAVTTHASPQGISHPCPNHLSQSQDLYCETCKVLICRDCILAAHQHQEHKYSFIKDLAAKQKEAILMELEPVEILAEEATTTLTEIKKLKREVISHEEDLTKEIKMSFDTLSHVLEEQKQTLLVNLQQQTDLKLDEIEMQQQEIEIAGTKFQQVMESVYSAATHDDDGEFLTKMLCLVDVISTLSQVSLNDPVEPDLVLRILSPARIVQACASTNYVRKGVPDPQKCSAKGAGLIGAKIDTPTTFTVHVVNEHGIPCSGKVSAELKTLRDGAITQPQVTACSPSQYKVSYTPTVRGIHKLSIKVNGEHITNSPFKVLNREGAVAEIIDMVSPSGLHSTTERILACDFGGNQIAVYNHGFMKIRIFEMKLKGPNEVTTDSQSNIYVTTSEDNSLHKFTKDGTHVKTVTGTGRKKGQFSCPNGMCIFEDRFLCVCDSNNSRVLVFDLNLKYSYEVNGNFCWPSDLDVDSSGKLYVSDYKGGCIKVFAPSGKYSYTINYHLLKKPVNVKIFEGVLYVSDKDMGCVFAFTLSGDYIGSSGHGYIRSPVGLAIDENGFIYVSNEQDNIVVFSNDLIYK